MSSYDVHRGKATRIRLVREILADAGGRIEYDVLKMKLRSRGYPHLIERLTAMGFDIDDEGYVSRG